MSFLEKSSQKLFYTLGNAILLFGKKYAKNYCIVGECYCTVWRNTKNKRGKAKKSNTD
jgi:hypothetical protein